MLMLKTLKVRGFRAYRGQKTFAFDSPIVLLFGGNHQGKSSTLNAVEWCLFGGECIGGETGIRERIDWEIPNRGMRPPDVAVEIELEDGTTLSRFAISRKWISPRKDDLEIILPDHQSLKGEKAAEKLSELHKSSFRDFLTTVYQHQEAIRVILTQEPKDRNDAIDRLLGLSDYRNILWGIEAAKLPRLFREISDHFDGLVRDVDVALRTRESDLKDKRKQATDEGIKGEGLTEKGATEIAKEVKGRLQKFASETGLSLAGLEVPEQWKKLQSFQKIVIGEIKRFRSEMPDVQEQQRLYGRRSQIVELKASYDQSKERLGNVRNALEAFVKQHGDGESIDKRKVDVENLIETKRRNLKEVNARANVVMGAMDYLRLQGIDKEICPVCGKKTIDLLAHLEKEWESEFKEEGSKVQTQINELNQQLETTDDLLTKHSSLHRDMETADKEIGRINKRIEVMLGRQIGPRDDCSAILDKELCQIDGKLEDLEQAVKSKQERLDAISLLVGHIKIVTDILGLEEKKQIVEQVQHSSEYLQMEMLKDQMAVMISDVDNIKQAISEASHQAAQQKVAAAEAMIDGHFHRIANNPSVSKIKFAISVDPKTGLNCYAFKDQDGKDLTPVLSQGDLNAMALSIFLGMAGLEETNQPFGFIMLDDPSQSLGSEHKQRLVEILDAVAQERTVILSSMDTELEALASSKMTKAKTKYVFSGWTQDTGPQVERQ